MEEDYEGVPFIKYAESELPIVGRHICPPGHEHYYAPFGQIIKESVKLGYLYQGRLWDAYDKCSHDVSVCKVVNDRCGTD